MVKDGMSLFHDNKLTVHHFTVTSCKYCGDQFIPLRVTGSSLFYTPSTWRKDNFWRWLYDFSGVSAAIYDVYLVAEKFPVVQRKRGFRVFEGYSVYPFRLPPRLCVCCAERLPPVRVSCTVYFLQTVQKERKKRREVCLWNEDVTLMNKDVKVNFPYFKSFSKKNWFYNKCYCYPYPTPPFSSFLKVRCNDYCLLITFHLNKLFLLCLPSRRFLES